MENGDCVNIIRGSIAERLKAVDQEQARAEYTSICCQAGAGPGLGNLSIQYTLPSKSEPGLWKFEYTSIRYRVETSPDPGILSIQVYAAEQEQTRALEI